MCQTCQMPKLPLQLKNHNMMRSIDEFPWCVLGTCHAAKLTNWVWNLAKGPNLADSTPLPIPNVTAQVGGVLYIVRLVTSQGLGMAIDLWVCTSCTLCQEKGWCNVYMHRLSHFECKYMHGLVPYTMYWQFAWLVTWCVHVLEDWFTCRLSLGPNQRGSLALFCVLELLGIVWIYCDAIWASQCTCNVLTYNE